MTIEVLHGDCLVRMRELIDAGRTVQAVVCDPPYGLAFMGSKWDAPDNVAFRPETWRLCWELLPPGGHLLAFSGTRTYHRMACAIEDAGFEIRDMAAWLYGSGFPKSHNVSKGIDRANGDERPVISTRDAHDMRGGNLMERSQGLNKPTMQYNYTAAGSVASAAWQGWGTALKPALEPICLARKPLAGNTVAANVMKHGTGALNIDACRIAGEKPHREAMVSDARNNPILHTKSATGSGISTVGRWPANLAHDGSEEVMAAFPERDVNQNSGRNNGDNNRTVYGAFKGSTTRRIESSNGSAARFFYSAKADKGDRLDSKHPTVKPVDLMRWLVRLITPPGGTVLDPFAGSGTTGMACMAEGFDAVLIEREAAYVADIRRRIAHVSGDDTPLFVRAAE